MKNYIFLIFIICLNCYSPNVSMTVNKSNNANRKQVESEKKTAEQKKDISTEEFVYLFFNKNNFAKQTAKTVAEKPAEVNSNDFKVIVDYQYEGGRKIRLKNIKSGKEYVIKDNEKSGEIALVERSLLYYKFKIGNSIIKVKK
jgi:hypothetical protein